VTAVSQTHPDDRRIRFRVQNEFASVGIELDASGAYLHITDLRSGVGVSLDPLELEAITRFGPGDRRSMVDPSFLGLGSDGAFVELVPGEGEEPDFA
jgi:hypothetical protein